MSSTVLRAAAQTTVARSARPAFAAASRTQLLRPAVAYGARAPGLRRWLNTSENEKDEDSMKKKDEEFEEFLLDNKLWNFEDVKKCVEAKDGNDGVVIVGRLTPQWLRSCILLWAIIQLVCHGNSLANQPLQMSAKSSSSRKPARSPAPSTSPSHPRCRASTSPRRTLRTCTASSSPPRTRSCCSTARPA